MRRLLSVCVLGCLAGAAASAPASDVREPPPLDPAVKAEMDAVFKSLTAPRSGPPNPTTRDDLARAAARVVTPTPMPRRQAPAVARAVAIGRQLFDAWRREHGEGVPPDLREALDTAAAAPVNRCPGVPYRAIALPPAAGGAPVVYLFAWPEPEQTLQIGRHFRLELSADGRRVERIEASSMTCLAAPARQSAYAQVRSCAPTEFDVFLNLLHGRRFFVATEVGNWTLEGGAVTFLSQQPRPCLDHPMSRVLDRWVLFGRPATADDPYHLGFVYMDPRFGVVVRYFGDVALEGDDRYRRLPTRWESMRMVLHPESVNAAVAPLAADVVAALGLEASPAWRQEADDGLSPEERDLRLGTSLNHLSDSPSALQHLEPWAARAASRADLAYELGYAYNAVGRFADALALLEKAVVQHPENASLCREWAYAEQRLGRFESAAEHYARCLPLARPAQKLLKAEMAGTLAELMSRLGDEAQCRSWRERAREWAEPDTAMYRVLHDPARPGAPCREP